MYGAVEGGGTKFLCAVATAPDPAAIVATARIDTRDAAATLGDVAAFFKTYGRLRGLGIASFGPIELDESRPGYGRMLATPKPGWSHEPILARLAAALDLPSKHLRIETDVNAAALGEHAWGAGRGADPLLYVTVGTGIGGGAILAGRPLRGLLHPEMGHVPVPPARLADGSPDDFAGYGCPFHDRCWEAMAAGPALATRLGKPADEAARDDPIWPLEAQYLALGLMSCLLVLSPRRIVVGGGIVESRASWLLPMVRRELAVLLNGYIPRAELADDLDRYVVPPELKDPSPAIAGALALAGGVA